jgi:hypothetical protein
MPERAGRAHRRALQEHPRPVDSVLRVDVRENLEQVRLGRSVEEVVPAPLEIDEYPAVRVGDGYRRGGERGRCVAAVAVHVDDDGVASRYTVTHGEADAVGLRGAVDDRGVVFQSAGARQERGHREGDRDRHARQGALRIFQVNIADVDADRKRAGVGGDRNDNRLAVRDRTRRHVHREPWLVGRGGPKDHAGPVVGEGHRSRCRRSGFVRVEGELPRRRREVGVRVGVLLEPVAPRGERGGGQRNAFECAASARHRLIPGSQSLRREDLGRNSLQQNVPKVITAEHAENNSGGVRSRRSGV